MGNDGPFYRGQDSLLSIVSLMHGFVPRGILPDLNTAAKMENILFPVLKLP